MPGHIRFYWQSSCLYISEELNTLFLHSCVWKYNHRAESKLAPSQWEMSLQSNAISHWLGANPETSDWPSVIWLVQCWRSEDESYGWMGHMILIRTKHMTTTKQITTKTTWIFGGLCFMSLLPEWYYDCTMPVTQPQWIWTSESHEYVTRVLTHLPLDSLAGKWQTTFSNAFLTMKICEFQLIFHWSLFLRVKLTIFQSWFR